MAQAGNSLRGTAAGQEYGLRQNRCKISKCSAMSLDSLSGAVRRGVSVARAKGPLPFIRVSNCLTSFCAAFRDFAQAVSERWL
jgi:hypothetical protein